MLLVDRILEIGEGRIVGMKNVTANEPYFQGHFPGAPIMPGVLIVEAMAQCAGIYLLREIEDRDKKLFFFGGIDKARFRKPVVPGDQLIMEIEMMQRRAGTAKMRGVAKVDGAVVAEAEMLTIMSDRPE